MENISQLHPIPRLFARLRFPENSLETLLRLALAYALPLMIALISLVALLSWQKHYGSLRSKPLEFTFVSENPVDKPTPDTLFHRLSNQPSVRFAQVHGVPVWFRLPVSAAEREDFKIDIPNKLASSLMCWDTGSVPARFLGSSDRNASLGSVAPFKSGFSVSIQNTFEKIQSVSCKVAFSGPGDLKLLQWTDAGSRESENEFSNFTGLIDGGLIVLSIFLFFTALITRESVYALLSMWLIASLRVAAFYGGWDFAWLGFTIPGQLLPRIQLFTFAIYYSLTCFLFLTLFQNELTKSGFKGVFRIVRASCLFLLVLSLFSTPKLFFDIFPIQAVIATFGLLFFLSKISALIRTRRTMWYCISLTIAVSVNVFAMIPGVVVGSELLVFLSLLSGLLTSFSIAEKMRDEQADSTRTKVEFKTAMDLMPIGLFTLNQDGDVVFGNPAFFACLNLLKEHACKWQDVFGVDSWRQLKSNSEESRTSGIDVVIDSRTHADPRSFLVGCSHVNGQINGTIQDVSEKYLYERSLRFLKLNDPLTSVLNRFGIEDFILKLRTADKEPVFVAHLNIDRFKIINDLYGHQTGDALLKEICSRMNALVGTQAKVGRVGGAQFLLAISASSQDDATRLCQTILLSINAGQITVGGQAFSVKGHMGLMAFGASADLKTTIAMASRACAAAKAASGNGLVFYDDDTDELAAYLAEMALTEAVSSPSLTDRLYLAMQPILSLASPHSSLNFEVLLRMDSETGHPVRTDHLIKAAELGGQMSVIDEWVLRGTLNWLRQEKDRLKQLTHVFINLNGSSLNDEVFLQKVAAILRENQDLASYLCYEITESVALQDLTRTQEFISIVRSFGAKVALDDFGAGYTSFSYLKSLTCDFLKIDGSFIVDMNAHPSNISIVKAIVTLAQSLQIKTVAEWAEDPETVRTLLELGVDYVQGFVVAKPMKPAQIFAGLSSASFITNGELTTLFSASKIEFAA